MWEEGDREEYIYLKLMQLLTLRRKQGLSSDKSGLYPLKILLEQYLDSAGRNGSQV